MEMSSVRVGNELGAGHPKSAAFSVVIVTVFSFIISVAAAIIVMILRHVISYGFTEGERVAEAVSDRSLSTTGSYPYPQRNSACFVW